MENILYFDLLKEIFNKNGFRLYVIGGTSRDYLLGVKITDYDFVSDATPLEMAAFLENVDDTFAKYGTIRLKIDGTKIDISTLREEGEYFDSRHPSYIKFVKNLIEDVYRRDFTINAIYIDENYSIHDFVGGVDDLHNHILRFIGDPKKRVEEDPLRILRGERFAKKYNLTIEENTLLAFKECRYLLDKLNPEKIKEELRKAKK